MAESDDLEGGIKQEVGEDVPVHNTKDPDEVFLTNKSRLKLALFKYKDGVRSLRAWINPFVLLATVGSILLVGNFQQTLGMSGSFWRAVYFVIGVIAFVWLIDSVLNYIRNRDKAEVESVIEDLKKEDG